MTSTKKIQLPQNVRALLGETGESLIALKLSLMLYGKPWNVSRNLTDPGYDVLLSNHETGERIRIEVKSRQRIVTRQDPSAHVNFYATRNEYDNLEVMICWFVDHNGIYVVPKEKLTPNPAKTTW